MSRRPAGALAGIAMIFLFATPAGVARPSEVPAGVFDVPRPSVPFRDVVASKPDISSAKISATAMTQRYPVGDHKGSTIAVGITAACRETCAAADPQAIAGFIGTLPHGPEVGLLTVQLDTRWQIGYDCGYGAQACYDTWRDLIIISGDDELQPDGATREFVLAHEYGHHLAQHRPAPPPFSPAVDWGTPHWGSYMNVCQGQRRRRFFPGNEGRRYYRNPGEAFAESFAFNRFPDSHPRWAWTPSLRPDAKAFAAIRQDVYRPWSPRRFTIRGRLPSGAPRGVARTLRTPLDGRASFQLQRSAFGAFELVVRSGDGRELREISGSKPLKLTICNQGSLLAIVKPRGGHGHRFTLAVNRP